MNLYLRLLIALCGGIRRPLHHADELECSFRVWPHDIDAFGHMNNGRYLQIMDVARVRWMARTGVLSAMLRKRWSGVLGGALTNYRHSLRPFQRYRVQTRLVHWDQRWFFFEHRFLDRAGRCVAAGVSRAALRCHRDWVRTGDVVEHVAPNSDAPEAPDWVASWLDLDRQIFDPWRQKASAAGGCVDADGERVA